MRESAAPWRALEDPPDGGPSSAGVVGSSPTVVAGGQRAQPWLIVGGLAVASLMLAVAVWLAASGGSGSIEVVGDAAAILAVGDATSPEPGRAHGFESAGAGGELVVDVQGAVLRPGIVRLPAGARVADAIAAAGGFGPRVAAERVGQVLNLAAALEDGDQVIVPSRDDPLPSNLGGSFGGGAGGGGGGGGGGPAGAASVGGPVDLNTATAAELDALPGIGPVTAAKILAARDEQPFASVDELRTRKIVGAATFDKIRELVTVG